MAKDSEFLSFPTIYCGKARADNKDRTTPVHYSTICKWELRSQDRRVAQSVPNTFYKSKKLQIKQIKNSACISLRKCKTKGTKYTLGDLKSEDYVKKLIHQDEGFRVFRNLRGSPPYFEKSKKDLFAMIPYMVLLILSSRNKMVTSFENIGQTCRKKKTTLTMKLRI